MTQNPRMKLLLLLAALVATGLCELPAPLDLNMSSSNFKHRLNWTGAPGSPRGVTYHVYARNSGREKQVASSEEPWADVKLFDIYDSYILSVKSSFNTSRSPSSKTLKFTPYLNTVITAPNVTVSGCGNCILLNISLPKVHGKVKDLNKIYKKISYNVSWQRKALDAVDSIVTPNQTVTIPHLLPHTQYCVQVTPKYLEVKFHSSPWKCVFTSTLSSQSLSVFAVVGLVAVLVVLCVSAVVLILFALQYTGILCKVKEALPHHLHTNDWQRSFLRLERTVPEPVSLLPRTGRQQDSVWDQDEDEQETNQRDQRQDPEEDQYMNRCPDLSSDSSSGSGPRSSSCQSSASSSCQSSASVISRSEQSQNEETVELKEDQITYNENWTKKELYDWTKKELYDYNEEEEEEWHKELEKNESVNLMSVTIMSLEL